MIILSDTKFTHLFNWLVSAWVARWFVFKPKIPIWVNFGGSCDGRFWYILWPLGLSNCHLVYFIWSFKLPFGTLYLVFQIAIWYIFPVLVSFLKKNLATLVFACFL
jgi:hypothetical protein